MNKLMKMTTGVVGIVAMLCLAGCGSKAPDQVALDVFRTIQEGKADQAFLEKNCTKETAAVFGMFGSMMQKAMKGATWVVTQTYIDDDIATVKIKQSGGENAGEETYYLKKTDGNWKLHVDKENPGKDMISKKTLAEVASTLGMFFGEFDESAAKRTCTDEFIKEIKENLARLDPAQKAVNAKAKIIANSGKIDKHDPNEAEVSLKIILPGGKEDNARVKLKRLNGTWKINTF